MAVMYVWTKSKDSWGHASLSFNDNSSGKSLPFSFESSSLPGRRRRRTRSSRGGAQDCKSPFSGTNNIFEWEQMFSKLSWLWNPPVLKLPDPPLNRFYISWWPTEDKSKNSMKKKKSEGRTKKCLPVDYEDDRNDFTGREFTHRFYIRIGAKGLEKIQKWWNNIKDKGGYHFALNNCCHAVVQALREGGIEIDPSLIIIRTPGDMVGLGKELEKKTADEELNKDVKRWKKIRYETLSKLINLKQELCRENEILKAARKAINITTGASLFVGALLAPLTWGASLVGAAVMTTGAAGIPLVIETIVERNVIGTTQAAVDKDKTETIRLRQRAVDFLGTQSSPFAEELFTVNLDTIFGLREQSLLSFIKGWAGTDSTSLLNVIAKLEMYTRNLESELHTVEKVQDKYSMP